GNDAALELMAKTTIPPNVLRSLMSSGVVSASAVHPPPWQSVYSSFRPLSLDSSTLSFFCTFSQRSLGSERGAHARLEQHTERHHHHEVLLALALHLPDCRGRHGAPGVAVDPLVLGETVGGVPRLLLTVVIHGAEGRLLAELYPGVLRSTLSGSCWG